MSSQAQAPRPPLLWQRLSAWWRSFNPAYPASNAALRRRSLFQKYFLVLFAAVVVPLLANGISEAWFGYHDQRGMLDARLRIEASAAANRIQGFLDGIRDQMGWTAQLAWTKDNVEAHRLDAVRLLRQVPAIVDDLAVVPAGAETDEE